MGVFVKMSFSLSGTTVVKQRSNKSIKSVLKHIKMEKQLRLVRSVSIKGSRERQLAGVSLLIGYVRQKGETTNIY